jgi:hypothetical protein
MRIRDSPLADPGFLPLTGPAALLTAALASAAAALAVRCGLRGDYGLMAGYTAGALTWSAVSAAYARGWTLAVNASAASRQAGEDHG